MPALFELLGVDYTGNRPLALSLCQKKPQAKALLAAPGCRSRAASSSRRSTRRARSGCGSR